MIDCPHCGHTTGFRFDTVNRFYACKTCRQGVTSAQMAEAIKRNKVGDQVQEMAAWIADMLRAPEVEHRPPPKPEPPRPLGVRKIRV